MRFSLLLSVYNKENHLFLKESFDSILNQSLLPSEVVIVEDGPLNNELKKTIESFLFKFPNEKNIIRLDKNYGLGYALSIGLLNCKYEIVARMDSDDICKADRFLKQINVFKCENDLDVLGTIVEEFKTTPGDYSLFKIQPQYHLDIYKKSKYLNPISHPSVMFKKSKVLSCGSYIDMPYFEDYFLWIRMLKNGSKFSNLQEPLLYFRIGNGMINRRHGFNYLKNEINFYYTSFKINHINIIQLFYIIVFKSFLRLLPIFITSFIYKILARNSK